MSLNKYDSSTGELTNLASGSRIWTGTKETYEIQKQAGTLPNNCLIILTNDEEELAQEVIENDPRAVTSGAVYNAVGSLGTAASKDSTTTVAQGSTDLPEAGAVYNMLPAQLPTTWSNKTWSGLTDFSGNYIWTDGDNIYFSNDSDQYVLDKSTSTWQTKSWSGLTSFGGSRVWTDGNNIYYSYNTDQYVLNKSTSTWEPKTWSGLTSFGGINVWTDGTNIYFSSSSKQYVLNKSTSTWEPKTWSGLTSFYGQHVWTDGTNIYFSNGSIQYVLNKSTSTWEPKTWSGLTSFTGEYIWTDDDNIYYSNDSDQYVLNKSTSTWNTKTWDGLTNFYGVYVWTDGTNIYFSSSNIHCALNKSRGFGSAAAMNVTTSVTSGSADVVTSGAVYEALHKTLVPWAQASDSEVAAMLNAYYNDELTLAEIQSVWHVGDIRTITLGSIGAIGVGESHRSQNVDIVILDFEHDDLTTAINGHTKALITVQLKDCLRDATIADDGGSSNTEHGYMNDTNTNVGGWTDSKRRAWCNNYFYNAIPASMRTLIKPVNKLTSAGNQSDTINTDSDKCFLVSEIEVLGEATRSKTGEGNQYNYFETASNKYKLPKWDSSASSDSWWERSPNGSTASNFCRVGNLGGSSSDSASGARGLAPAWCL